MHSAMDESIARFATDPQRTEHSDAHNQDCGEQTDKVQAGHGGHLLRRTAVSNKPNFAM
jgi:hypothetical protein